MLVHIVMWRLKDNALERSRTENAQWIKTSLESLVGQIPELKFAQVGINANENEAAAYDVVLVSKFDSMEEMGAYQVNPLHVAVGAELKQMCRSRVVCDYWE